MRKILLGTTAVVGLALVAPEAFAQQARRPAARPAAAAPAPAPAPVAAPAPAPVTQVPSLYGQGNHGSPGSPAVSTSGLMVRLGGFFDFSYGNVSDTVDKGAFRNVAGNVNSAQGRQRSDFRTEAELNVYVDGTAANGMRYGAVFELQMDTMTTTTGTGTGVDYDELYGFVKGGWGELRFGQEDSAASLMQVRRPSVLWMGSDDAWDEFIASGTPYIMSGVNDGNDSTKIIYLSPQISGFDVGFSYSPNRYEGEAATQPTNNTVYQRDFTGLTNEIAAALRYRGTMGPVGVSAALVGQWADAPRQGATGVPVAVKAQNVNAYSAGLALSAMGFTVGGEYTWGNYNGTAPAGAALAKGLDGSSHWLVSGVYTTGPLSIGVMHGKGTQDNGTNNASVKLEDRTQTYFGVGAAYVLAPGLTLFANYNQISDENMPTTAVANKVANPAATGTSTYSINGSNTRDITVVVAGVRVAF